MSYPREGTGLLAAIGQGLEDGMASRVKIHEVDLHQRGLPPSECFLAPRNRWIDTVRSGLRTGPQYTSRT
ncbi:hypothetical protein FQZ97_1163600 [compost metagenome]